MASNFVAPVKYDANSDHIGYVVVEKTVNFFA